MGCSSEVVSMNAGVGMRWETQLDLKAQEAVHKRVNVKELQTVEGLGRQLEGCSLPLCGEDGRQVPFSRGAPQPKVLPSSRL